MSKMRLLTPGVVLCGLVLGVWRGGVLRADEIVLTHGGRVRGERLEAEERGATGIVFRSRQSVRFSVRASRVVGTRRETPSVETYRKHAPLVMDTASSHWDCAEWCRERGLHGRRRDHLLRVVELDPRHVPARRALGYAQIDGRWATRSQVLREKGFVHYQGKWRLPQEIELLRRRRLVLEAEQKWISELRHWRSRLDRSAGGEARRKILAIRDPNAIRALRGSLNRDRLQQARLLYVEALGGIADDRATAVLMRTALGDRDEEVFHACVEQITLRKTPAIVKQLAETLQSNDNHLVNRAAFILGQLRDREAVAPLIEALVTTHVVSRPRSRRMTFSFARPSFDLPMGLSASQPTGRSTAAALGFAGTTARLTGPTRSRAARYQVVNQNVLDALVDLAGGVNFSFDRPAWRHWHAVQPSRRPDHGTVRMIERKP